MFDEKNMEWAPKYGKEVPVNQSPKYKQARANAIDILQKHPYLKESDFWILMHETKSGKMNYDGLIISHLGCLKINENLPKEKKFIPSCVSVTQLGYNNTLVFTYCSDAQGIYEVGEVSPQNCKNAYVYAMALKRCFDRVVLKLSKIAFQGVLSDSEIDGAEEDAVQPEPDADNDLRAWRDQLSAKITVYCKEKNADRREVIRKLIKEFKTKQIGASVEACRLEIGLLDKWLVGEQ